VQCYFRGRVTRGRGVPSSDLQNAASRTVFASFSPTTVMTGNVTQLIIDAVDSRGRCDGRCLRSNPSSYASFLAYRQQVECKSSNITGAIRLPLELTETMRAPSAAANALCKPTVSAKWPRKSVANCISQPSECVPFGEAP